MKHNPVTSSVNDCRIISLPQIRNSAGNLTPVTGGFDIPFEIKRIYFLYDIPGGSVRGGHAHRELYQVIIALSGSFDVSLDDGSNKATYTMVKPNLGLYIVPGIWRDLLNFSSGAVCLVLASEKYIEADYIRDYKEFCSWKSLR